MILRSLRNFLWFSVGVLIAFIGVINSADAASVYFRGNVAVSRPGGGTGAYATADLACRSWGLYATPLGQHYGGDPSYAWGCVHTSGGSDWGGYTERHVTCDNYMTDHIQADVSIIDCPCSSTGDATATAAFDVGTDSSNWPPPLACYSGCLAQLNGTLSLVKSTLVGGARHYWYGYAKYSYTGMGNADVCTAGTSTTPATSASSPSADTCPAGQYVATVKGINQCVSASTGQVTSTGPQYVAGTSCSKVTNADSTITQTCITQASDGSTTTQATTYPAGTPDSSMTKNSTTTTSTPNTVGGGGTITSVGSGTGSSSGSGTTTNTDPGSMGNYCASHPNAVACKDAAAAGADETAYCTAHPTAAQCIEHWSPSGTGGAWTDLSSALTTAQNNFNSQWASMQSDAANLFGTVTGGVSSLPCDSTTVLGHTISMCVSTYSGQLAPIASMVLLIAWITAAFIILR